MASANVYSPDYDPNGNPKDSIPELKDAIENAVVDAENFASATGSFTDDNGNTFQKGAKGWAADAEGYKNTAQTEASNAASSATTAQNEVAKVEDTVKSRTGGDTPHWEVFDENGDSLFRHERGKRVLVEDTPISETFGYFRDGTSDPLWRIVDQEGRPLFSLERGKRVLVQGEPMGSILGIEQSGDVNPLWQIVDFFGETIIEHRRGEGIYVEGEQMRTHVAGQGPDRASGAGAQGPMTQHVTGQHIDRLLAQSFSTSFRPQLQIDDASNSGTYEAYFNASLQRVTSTKYLLFCEGRKNSGDDAPKDLLQYTLTYDGSWSVSSQKVIVSEGNYFGSAPASPQGVSSLRLPNGRVLVHTAIIENDRSTQTGTIAQIYSDDEGASWTAPTDIGASLPELDITDGGSTWDFLLPAEGMTQIRAGQYEGRLLSAGFHDPQKEVAILKSDDDGSSWSKAVEIPEPTDGHEGFNETHLGATGSGVVVGLARAETGPSINSKKLLFRLTDGGTTFSEGSMTDEQYSETKGALIQAFQRNGDSAPKLVSLSIAERSGGRRDLRAYISYDEGHTWPIRYQIERGETGYASLAPFDQDKFLVVHSIESRNILELRGFSLFDALEQNRISL